MKHNVTLTLNLILMLASGICMGALFENQAIWALLIKLACLAMFYVVYGRLTHWKQGLILGALWGAGCTLTGMSWLYAAMHDIAGLASWISSIALVLFSLLLGAFNGVGLAFAVYLKRFASGKLHMVTFIASWLIAEWLRTWVLTGLPWLSVGYAFIDSPITGVASAFGVMGVSALAVGWAVCIAQLIPIKQLTWRTVLSSSTIACLIMCIGFGLQYVRYTTAHFPILSVSLLQGNVPQTLKFNPQHTLSYIERYVDLIASSPSRLVITPETAIPMPLDSVPSTLLAPIKNISNSRSTVVIGTIGIFGNISSTGAQYTNRLSTPFDVNPWHYDKTHLVPFGESIPTGFQWFLDLMHIPLSGLATGGADQPNLNIDQILIASNICYEEIFAHEWRHRAAQAHVLLNASNFGWYASDRILKQHTHISRMRALEFQKPYLSATNNGTTLAVLPNGDIQQALAINTQGALNLSVQGMKGTTPYAYWGDWGIVCLALGMTFLAIGATRLKHRRHQMH